MTCEGNAFIQYPGGKVLRVMLMKKKGAIQ